MTYQNVLYIYITKANNMTTQNIEIGKTYSYTNKSGYESVLIVTRVTDKSVFATWADGTGEHREGLKNFSKYTLKN